MDEIEEEKMCVRLLIISNCVCFLHTNNNDTNIARRVLASIKRKLN